MTVKDHAVAVSKDTLDLAASIRMIRHDSGNELLHAFHAVFDQRIVLVIGGSSIKPEGIFDPAGYTGLCAEMARDAAARARTTAGEISDR